LLLLLSREFFVLCGGRMPRDAAGCAKFGKSAFFT